MTNENRLYIINLAKKFFKDRVYRKDSNSFTIPQGSTRKNETINFINFISRRELIITDRLHGMIFSIITGTRCIVFGNNYHKVVSSYYSWFKDLEYVTFIDKKDIKKGLENKIKQLKNLNNYTIFNHKMFEKHYALMNNILKIVLFVFQEINQIRRSG
jgi:exopolysaccharide biosynthesis predicted pyruvyltransferase EpsI